MRDRIFELTDVVRETGYAIHCYHGPGHLERVYENALVHRLRKRGIAVEQQKPLTVHDEDGTILGEYVTDIFVEGQLIFEVKAAKAILDEHVAQTVGYLRSARLEHGVVVNFGAPKFQIRKLVMSEALHQPERDGPPPLVALLFAVFCVFFGYSSSSVAAGSVARALGLPVFRHQGVVLDYRDLHYNPSDDIIYPSVIEAHKYFARPLGRYYLYYAPHNAPGGICLAYADALEGPWREYSTNPVITREWPPHYKVSHVSGSDAIWNAEEQKLFLYFHGENSVTRLASSTDGIHFDYEGSVVTTEMFDQISEASYGRVFRYTLPGKDNRYIMLLMGNNRDTRRIYLAWSRDGRRWETRRTPVMDPPPGTDQVAGAWYLPWQGRHYLIAHANRAADPGSFNVNFNLYVAQIDAAFEQTKHLGLFYPRTAVSGDNEAVMSPCIIAEGSKVYMFVNIGPRLHNKIALAVAEVGQASSPHQN